MKKKYAEANYDNEDEDEPASLSASKREARVRPEKTYAESDGSEQYA